MQYFFWNTTVSQEENILHLRKPSVVSFPCVQCSPRASSLSSVSLASLNSVGLIFSQRWYRSLKTHSTNETVNIYIQVWKNCAGIRLGVHLQKLSIALIGGLTVVFLQELCQKGNTLVHLLDGVDSLRYLLCSPLILKQPNSKRDEQISFQRKKYKGETHRRQNAEEIPRKFRTSVSKLFSLPPPPEATNPFPGSTKAPVNNAVPEKHLEE